MTFILNDLTLTLPEALSSPAIVQKLASGQYERAEARAVEMRVKPGMRVLELGAGLGYVTALCARAAGPDRVTAVEPLAQMLPVIRENLARNGLAGVDLRHGAVAAGEGAVARFRQGAAFWASALAEADEGGREAASDGAVEVPRLALAALFAEVRPQVVVMDIEGAEAALCALPWPDCVRHVVMELHRKRYGDAGIARVFDGMRANGLVYDPGPSRGGVVAFRRMG